MKMTLEKPLHLNGAPTNCEWCGGSLARLRNVYKGIECRRFYCSMEHLSRGEDREIRRRAALAGTVHSPWYLVVAALLTVFVLGFTVHPKKARAHDPNTHQADSLANAKSDAYGLCCNGEDYTRVTVWERTETGFRVLVGGKWFEASHRVKVSNMENPDGEAKVWINGPDGAKYIRCFMPGVQG